MTQSEAADVRLDLPPGFSYRPGSATLNGGPLFDPSINGSEIGWSIDVDPGVNTLTVQADPGSDIGPALATLTVFPDVGPESISSASVDVVDGAEPDDTPAEANGTNFNALELAYINSPTDTDWRSVPVSQGDELSLSLEYPGRLRHDTVRAHSVRCQSATPQPVPTVTDVAPGTGREHRSHPPAATTST